MSLRQSSRFDLLGLGCAAVDEMLYVERYPPADAKVRVMRRERRCGGLTAAALIAAQHLGASCAYAGVLGFDDSSEFVLESLKRTGVNLAWVTQRRGASPVRSTIIVDEHAQSRNVFYSDAGVLGAHPSRPPAEIIRKARVLLVDRFGVRGMVRAARCARRSGVSVVGDFENHRWPRFAELFALVDHVIVSAAFAAALTGERRPDRAAQKLWSGYRAKRLSRQAVVVTCGAEGCFFLGSNRPRPGYQPAFKVEARDTTGCGDVFHGAYAAALARGQSLEERIRFASAAAALKAAHPQGRMAAFRDIEKLCGPPAGRSAHRPLAKPD